MILHEKTKKEFGYTFETASNTKKFYCICDYCGKEFSRDKRTIVQCNKVISKDSCGIGLCKRTKSEEVQLLKYGVINKGGSKESIEKRNQTSLERFGNENYANSDARKKDNLEKLGVEHHTQTDDWKQKIKDNNLEKLGVEHHTQDKNYQEKLKEKCKEKYGVDHFMMTPEFKEKVKETMVERYGTYYIETEECRNKIVETCIAKYGKPFPLQKKFGKTQKDISDWLNLFGFNFKNDCLVIENKEIDIYDENISLAIEYCGLYWHNELSPKPKLKSYHFDKYVNCKNKNIRLITIFEDEWIFRKNQCKNYLKSVLGVFDKKVQARKCEIKRVNKVTSNEFYEANHILGKCNRIIISFGLYFEDELIGIISLGKHHRQTESNNIILSRLCFKDGIQVIGGSSRLFSRCIKWAKEANYQNIISWSDNRWSCGKIYDVLGFKLEKELAPDYSYVDLNKHFIRLSKQSQKKSNNNCPKELTEREWCIYLGLARIWDCGKKRWVYKL